MDSLSSNIYSRMVPGTGRDSCVACDTATCRVRCPCAVAGGGAAAARVPCPVVGCRAGLMAGLVNSTRVAVTLYSVSGLFTVRSSLQREYSRSLDMDV